MKPLKDFDCVELKNRIQEQLLNEYRGMSDEEVEIRRQEKLMTSDHPAARLWRKLTKAH